MTQTSMMCLALSTDAWVSNENLASTSVDTFPGTIFRISEPNSTSSRSRAASTWVSMSPPWEPVSHREREVCFLHIRETCHIPQQHLSALHTQLSLRRRGSKKGSLWHPVACIWQLLLALASHRLKHRVNTYWQSLRSRKRRPRITDQLPSLQLELQIHTVPVALSCSREVDMMAMWC